MDRRSFLISAQALVPLSFVTSVGRASIDGGRRAAGASQAMRLRDTLGVTVHFIEPIPKQLDAMVKAGLRWVRHDLQWENVEKVRGTYNFSRYDQHYNALLRTGLSAYAILDYGNPLYDGGRSPIPGSDAYMGFLRFAEAAASRYSGLVELWEIWNEPNNAIMWKPQPNVDAYASLCRDVAKIVRRATPRARVVAGATAGVDTAYLQRCAQLGAFADVDTVAVHPYRWTLPETAIAEMKALQATLQAMAGRALEVISGEWGYTTANNRVSPDLQAAYYARMMLSNFGSGKTMTVWYDLQQDGSDPVNGEHNFGIMKYATLAPLPAYGAAVVLNGLLGEATLVENNVASDGTWTLRLDRRGIPATAIWAAKTSVSRTLTLAGPTAAYDLTGSLLWQLAGSATRTITLDPRRGPTYILGSDVTVAS